MIEKRYKAQDEALYRRMLLPWEEVLRRGLHKPPCAFRWFKSPNVTPIEYYRRAAETQPSPPLKAA